MTSANDRTDDTKSIYIFDLDGTLADISHRLHFIKDRGLEKPDWTAFFEACGFDKPKNSVIRLARDLHRSGAMIMIFSGRGDEVRGITERWLEDEGVPYDYLLMRPRGDYTPDEELKRSWLTTGLPEEFLKKIVCIFDDRDKVVKMWRDEGYTCAQVSPGSF
ncbi:MAG: hypothetical protein K9K86_09860 [Pseudomonadales bacterium]|nr:hypothetical protein [Pseudomonadales bacterium]